MSRGPEGWLPPAGVFRKRASRGGLGRRGAGELGRAGDVVPGQQQSEEPDGHVTDVPEPCPAHGRTGLYLGGVGLSVTVALAAAPDPRAEESLSLTENYCDARNVVAVTLRHDFDETPRRMQVTAEGMTMELWASELMGTWTVVHHGGDGISCIVTSGQGWTGATDAAVMLDAALGEAVWGA